MIDAKIPGMGDRKCPPTHFVYSRVDKLSGKDYSRDFVCNRLLPEDDNPGNFFPGVQLMRADPPGGYREYPFSPAIPFNNAADTFLF